MKTIIGVISAILIVCVVSACKPNITKKIGDKTIQAVEWTCSKMKSGIKSCFSKMDLKKNTK